MVEAVCELESLLGEFPGAFFLIVAVSWIAVVIFIRSIDRQAPQSPAHVDSAHRQYPFRNPPF